MKFTKKSRLFQPILVGSVVGVLCAIGSVAGVLDSWSNRSTDRLFLSRAPDPSITIIAIDDASINQLGRWPWPRKIHAELIQKLSDAGVKAIGYDVNFPESSDAENDQALADALKASGRVVLPVELQLKAEDGRLTYATEHVLSPIFSLKSSAAALGHSNTPPDADGTVRRVPLNVWSPDSSPGWNSFVAEVARLAGRTTNLEQAPPTSNHRMIINFTGPPLQTFRTIRAVDVIRGTADLSVIKNGVAFVGSTAPDLHDALLVPTSNGVLMPGVEIHASTYETIVSRRWLSPVPPLSMAIILVLLGLLVGVFVPLIRARWSIPMLISIWIATVVIAFISFDRGRIIDVVWPTLTLVFSYVAVTIERRVQSDRERRELKTAFSRYVSATVVDSILKDPSKLHLGGERKRMSVFFSDIRGFTTISEGLSPEKLVEALNIYLTRMTDIVFQHQGVLDKYIGDAVMAFWNAPFDQPDHAFLAVQTAIEMQKALDRMNEEKAFGDVEIRIGCGVNTGDMVVGNVGGTARFDYTVIGDNVNLGSRLEGLTKEYGVGIIITESTAKDVSSKILCRKLDKVAVKGKKEPVMIFEAVDFIENATSSQQTLVKAFETALDAYFARDFAGAITKCDVILATTPTDGPTKNLRERALHFKDTAPPTDWVGTWVFTKK